MNVDHIIESIQSTRDNYYKPDDPMRWPYQVGMLESKLREMAYIINKQTEHIRTLETKQQDN